ncbi:MAG: lysophospholipid acyltransferase family protein [Myxococcota bacterium]
MFEWLDTFGAPPLDEAQRQALRQAVGVNSAGYDPWGFNLETAERTLRIVRLLYRDYFKVQAFHTDRVPDERVIVVANHGGQIPLDGMLLATSMMMELEPPRLVRGMVERWVPGLPWFSTLFTRCGQVVGDPANAEELLRRDQSIMVFPEGVKGISKTWWKRYQLQSFGTGFVRLALSTNTTILPVGIIGSDDTYPALASSRRLGKLIGAPNFPITPTWPFLGPLGLVPLPVPIHLYFGEPIRFEGDPDESDALTRARVNKVRDAVQALLHEGLQARPQLQQLDDWARWGRK